jgi:hypothetical protein
MRAAQTPENLQEAENLLREHVRRDHMTMLQRQHRNIPRMIATMNRKAAKNKRQRKRRTGPLPRLASSVTVISP